MTEKEELEEELNFMTFEIVESDGEHRIELEKVYNKRITVILKRLRQIEIEKMANLRAGTTVGGDAVFTVGNISSYGLNFLNGNIGIGTTTPRCNLDLGLGNGDGSEVSNNAADYQLGLHAAQSTTGDIGRSIGFILSSGNVGAAITTADGGTGDATDLLFITGNSTSISEAMRIDSGGNVGIGTTSPAYKLDVHGWINAQADALSTDSVINLVASNANNYSAISESNQPQKATLMERVH